MARIQSLQPEICKESDKCFLVLDYTDVENPILLRESPDGKYVTHLCIDHTDMNFDTSFINSKIHEEAKLLSYSRAAVIEAIGAKPEDVRFDFDSERNIKLSISSTSDISKAENAVLIDEKVNDSKVIIEKRE